MATYLIGNIKGPKGADGVSPKAKVEQVSNGAMITITDTTGTTSALVRNGVDGDGNNIDLTPYATWAGLDTAINEVKNDYATKEDVETAVAGVNVPVTSVNGMVGEVVIPAPDLTPYATQTWVESKNYLETAPVSSVNGETGEVVLSAADIGALPADTVIPTKTSELTNDSNYVSASTLTASLATKQDALTAGSNITIENNVISATGGGSGFSGDYNDLTNKPDLSVYAESADLATVATTGSYNDLIDKPTIPTVPTNVSDFTNDAGYITSSDLPADELPTITAGDAGKVLAVNSAETGVEWTTPASGGGGVTYTAGDGIEIDSNNIINAIDRPASLSDPIFQLFRSGATMYPAIGGNEGNNLTTIEALANSLNKNGIAVVDGYELYSITPTLVNAVNNTTWKFQWFKIDSTTGNITITLYDANSTENFGSFRKNRAFALCGGRVFAFDDMGSARNILHNSFVSTTKTKAGTNYGSVDVFSALSALDTAITNKQDNLTAGEGITIENNVISATSSGGGSSYTDNDVYNAIQNRFGMARSEETDYFTTGSVTGNDGNATLTTDGIGQTNGIRISNSDGGDPYLDYPVQWDEALSDEVWVADYEGNTYRITSAWDEQTQKQTLTIAYPTALFGIGEKGLDVQHYSTSYTTTPLSYGYYNFDTIYNEMQNRGMGGGGSADMVSNDMINWSGTEATNVLGAYSNHSQSQLNFNSFDITYDSSNETWQATGLPWAVISNGNGVTRVTLYEDNGYVNEWNNAPNYASDGTFTVDIGSYSFDYTVTDTMITSFSNFNGFDTAKTYRIDWEIYNFVNTYNPISSQWMPYDNIYDEMVNRGLGGGGGSSFTPTNNDLLTWDGSAAASVLGAKESTSSIENTLYESEVTFDGAGGVTSGSLSQDVSSALYAGRYSWKAGLDVGWAEWCWTDIQPNYGYAMMNGNPDPTAQTVDMSIETGNLYGTDGMPMASPWSITIRFTCNVQQEGMYIWNAQNVTAQVVSFSTWPSALQDNSGTMYFRIVENQSGTNRTPINAGFIPVDNNTIIVNSDGRLQANVSGGSTVEMPALAPSAIYLNGQDGNTYEITVDSTGTLKATRYQN